MDAKRRRKGQIMLKCITLGAADAGKTSILRRHFLGALPLKHRVPTVGADFYSGRIHNPFFQKEFTNTHENIYKENQEVLLQMWDTAGRERFVHNSNSNNTKKGYATALSDVFFQHADAAMLVYDATSSTSFTQLLKWYSDLMEKMKSLQAAATATAGKHQQKFPVLIVANKMDIVDRQKKNPGPRKTVNQRHIKGLPTNDFIGKDFHYEYRVVLADDDNTLNKEKRSKSKNNNNIVRRREEISTFMSTGNTWTSDGSYLDSVLTTEDTSHPDRDMVLLWCMRNGLKHVEVSALDGSGLSKAMETLVELALESKLKENQEKIKEEMQKQQKRQDQHHHYDKNRTIGSDPYSSNNVLDLHQRYSSNDDDYCCFIIPKFHRSLKRV